MSDKPTPKVPALLGNRNAAKDGAGFDSAIRIECFAAQKGRWKQAAAGQKLAQWMRATLDQAAEAELAKSHDSEP